MNVATEYSAYIFRGKKSIRLEQLGPKGGCSTFVHNIIKYSPADMM